MYHFHISLFRPAPNRSGHGTVTMNHRMVSKSNIAAVEPYIHNPQHSPISTVPPSNNYYQKQMLQNMANLKLNTDANGNTDDLKMAYIAMNENDDAAYLLANKSHNKINSYGGGGGGGVGGNIGGANSNNNTINNINNISNDALMAMGNFSTAKKLDAKYQTLPHTAKYPMASATAAATTTTTLAKGGNVGGIPVAVNNYNNINSVNNNHSNNNNNNKHGNNNHQTLKENESLRMNGGMGDDMIAFQSTAQQPHQHLQHQSQSLMQPQQQQLTVHSMPLSTINKSVAHPVANGEASSPLPSAMKDEHALATALANDSKMLDSKLRPALKEKNNIPTTTALTTKDNNAVISARKPISSVAPTPISLVPKPVITVSAKVNMVAPSINSVTIVSHSEVAEKTPALPPKPHKAPDMDALSAAPGVISSNSSNTHKMNGSNGSVPTSSTSQLPTVVNVVNKANAPDTKTQTQSDYQFSMICPTQNHDNLPIKAKPLTIKKQPLSEQPRLRSLLPSAKPNQLSRRIEMPPSFLFPETEKAPLKGDTVSLAKNSATMTQSALTTCTTMATATMATAAATSTIAASADEPDKATTQTTNEEDIVVPVSNLVKRTKSALSGEGGKTKLARRVSFDPLALLLDASLEGELELVQKTATQVNKWKFSPSTRIIADGRNFGFSFPVSDEFYNVFCFFFLSFIAGCQPK